MSTPSLAGTRLEKYFHVGAFFDSRESEYTILGPFYREGIEAKEKVLTIVDPRLREDHLRRLEAAGIDAPACCAAGQLEVVGWEQAYLDGGVFDQHRMLDTAQAVFAAAIRQGYARSRFAGHMGWALEGRPGSEQLVEYEARVNDVLVRHRQPAICIYDISRLSGPLLMDLLRCHPLTLVGGVVRENPFYIPPDEFLAEIRMRHAVR